MDKFGEMTNSEICALIDDVIRGRNAERNRNILKTRLIDGKTFEQIAEEFDMSVRQIKSIVYHCMDEVFNSGTRKIK